jgi:hypothetical protein
MEPFKKKLLCSTAMALAFGAGIIVLTATDKQAALLLPAFIVPAAACAPCAPRGSCAPCGPGMPAAACGPCDPCAPFAACGPCDPCAAAPAAATECYVPRLQEARANPCAVENPCAAAAVGPCGPANPCAAENPCAAAAACAPCAACTPCGPCGPCAAAEVPDVTEEELRAVYECLLEHMRTAYGDDWNGDTQFAGWQVRQLYAAYADSGLSEARDFVDWTNVATAPYVSGTHGGRFVTNHVNEAGEEAYRRYEEIGEMPVGGTVAKPSFAIQPDGQAQLGPLFLMEKMEEAFYQPSDDWRYTMVMPDGTVAGQTQGLNAQQVEFCIGCHMAAPAGQDSLLFLPENLRVR